jgi:hypothetical protein
MDMGTDRDTDRKTDKDTNRVTNRDTDKDTDRDTDRETDRDTDRDKDRVTGRERDTKILMWNNNNKKCNSHREWTQDQFHNAVMKHAPNHDRLLKKGQFVSKTWYRLSLTFIKQAIFLMKGF